MEKVKNVFSKVWAWIKSHAIICVAVVAVVVLAIVAVSFIGGAEKRAVKKYISAVNSCDYNKVMKAMNVEGALAWQGISSDLYSSSYASYFSSSSSSKKSSSDIISEFKDKLDEVDDDKKDEYKDTLKKQYDKDNKGKVKIKLLKVVYSTPSKEDKNLKKVVCKVRVTSKPGSNKDDDEDSDEDKIWKNEKEYTSTVENYVTFYLYKNKVISAGI